MKNNIAGLNWRRGLSEILLIFVGITLALAFENWNADRELKAREAKLLVELGNDLRETREDLRRDILSTSNDIEALKALSMAISGERPIPAEEIGGHAGNLLSYSIFYPKSSAYQSIKTIGMDIIADDSLRTVISEIYELSVPRVLEGHDMAKATIKYDFRRYVRKHFSVPGGAKIESRQYQVIESSIANIDLVQLRPQDGDYVLSDPEFQLLVYELLNEYSYANATMKMLDKAISEVLERFATELN